MVDPVVKKKQHSAASSSGKSSNAGIMRSPAKGCAENTSCRKKEKAGPSPSSSEVSCLTDWLGAAYYHSMAMTVDGLVSSAYTPCCALLAEVHCV